MRFVLALYCAGILFAQPPGVVIEHSPQTSGQYIGSPGIAILADGVYLAKMDFFGPKSTENTRAVTRVFRSRDKGRSWERVTDVDGMYWASIFVHKRAVYLLGPEKQYGDLILMRSTDGGRSWSRSVLAEGKYHTAPVPVVTHRGRLWRAVEDTNGPGGWGSHFRALMISAPLNSDLMKPRSWTFSNALGRDPKWLDGGFGGWLEGNAVVTPDGRVVNILRADHKTLEKAAWVEVSADGKTVTFDAATGFIDFPGGSKKFTIRFDKKSRRYWTLSNQGAGPSTRNKLVLMSSVDSKHWTVHATLLEHPDRARHGFQYVDWLVEGKDIVFVSRTAFDDDAGGAHNAHDANFLTFHRVTKFRAFISSAAGVEAVEARVGAEVVEEAAVEARAAHRGGPER